MYMCMMQQPSIAYCVLCVGGGCATLKTVMGGGRRERDEREREKRERQRERGKKRDEMRHIHYCRQNGRPPNFCFLFCLLVFARTERSNLARVL